MLKKIIIFIVVMWIAVKVSGAIGYGLITLAGLVGLIESAKPLKWLVIKFTTLIDILIFVASIFATAKLGYNITASLVVAGVGYTLVYAPYVRHQARLGSKGKQKKRSNIASDYDWS